jgi:hypothetical protein
MKYLTLQVWSLREPNKRIIIKVKEIEFHSEVIYYPKKWRGIDTYDIGNLSRFATKVGFKIRHILDVEWKYMGRWKK